jgi:TolA-binding protein
MKRTERHRLKENELAVVTARASEMLATRRRELAIWGGAAALVLVVLAGWLIWRQQVNARAAELYARAMVVDDAPVVPPAAPDTPNPPSPPPGSYPSETAKLEAALPMFAEAAERYPSTPAGLSARYRQANILALLGRRDEAAAKYQEVIDREGRGILGEMARLGLAGLQVDKGEYEPAISTYKALSADSSTRVPLDGVLMQLGRAAAKAGKPDEAQRAYTRIVDEFPQSLYLDEARKELESLKKG